MIHRLTDLPLLDYSITVNVESLSPRAEINKEEKAHDRLAGDFASEKRLSLLTAMEKKQKKIAALMQGHTSPFLVEYIVRAWDKTREGLAAKTAALKNAINSMNGAQYLECALPTTAKKLFFQSWPGFPWGRYPHRKLYGESRYLADVLPFSATFTGHLANAEAIYDGTSRNLVGITTFAGSKGNETPQHAVLVGIQGLPRDRLERTLVLHAVQKQERTERMRAGILKKLEENPELKEAYRTLVKNLPADQQEKAMAILAARTLRTVAPPKQQQAQGARV